jgi:outer membrane translocation and assembly module TamA
VGSLDTSGNPEGGQSTALVNIELRRPIFGILSGVLFLDAGMVEEHKFRMTVDGLQYSAGGGIRFDTPVGPLRLDLGYKLNPPDSTVAPDGQEITRDRWRLHFSIGHAF